MSEAQTELKRIGDELLDMTFSPLFGFRVEQGYQPVMGAGNEQARVMFVGEAPGEEEAMSGVPFVGRAGKLFDELLSEVGIERVAVYVTNVVKDRPPENRTPTAEEMSLYGQLLLREIEVVKPQLVVALGRVAADFLLKHYQLQEHIGTMNAMHGRIYEMESLFVKLSIMVMYHPAVVLYDQRLMGTLRDDFEKLGEMTERLD